MGEPVTAGVPLPRGLSASSESWTLVSASGYLIPLQARVLDRWPDGSIRWALLDFQASLPAGVRSDTVALHLKGAAGRTHVATPLRIRTEANGITVETGAAALSFVGGDAAPFANVRHAGGAVLDVARSRLRVADAEGVPYEVRWERPILEEAGDLRAVVEIRGLARAETGTRLDLSWRIHAFAGLPVLRCLLTIRNPRRAAHPGGFWELGDPNSVRLRELTLVLTPAGTGPTRDTALQLSLDSTQWSPVARRRVQVYQESSGGDHWNSINHVNRTGVVPMRLRGYTAVVDEQRLHGDRATPIVVLHRNGTTIGAAVPAFWQNFPRAVSAGDEEVTIGFFPPQFPDAHELQGGEQKTHEAYLLFGTDPVTQRPLEWCRSRLVARMAPEWYAHAEAAPYLTPAASDAESAHAALVSAAVEGAGSFLVKREAIDEYGWRHFGDLYGDHEAACHRGAAPLVSHYNNQYDALAGFACQFMRTGDLRWWPLCDELAAHVVDIDIYHTNEDKAAYNHGLFWHTVHYVSAGRATHRTYPRAKGSPGGGPSSEHNYTTGLMLHYFLTGNAASRDAAIGLAQFVIDMDDGSKTVFRWVDRGDTGLATASGSPLYHGPGRGSGNSLNALLDGYRLTGNRQYVEKAEAIVRRCTHPQDHIDSLNLLDAENRWFYTMYLQSIGKYLDCKAELGELDGMYAYARAVLLRYARWMADHERPYLEQAERLQYPTETWPAQDIRKSEVFDFAARHADDAERPRLRERADFFFAYSTSALLDMPTRTFCRPLVLMLVHGRLRSHTRQWPHDRRPAPRQEWSGRPPRGMFVPQKTRAMRRVRMLAVLTAVAGLAVIVRMLT